jgi:hypothetical protein
MHRVLSEDLLVDERAHEILVAHPSLEDSITAARSQPLTEALASTKLESMKILLPLTRPASTHWITIRAKKLRNISTPHFCGLRANSFAKSDSNHFFDSMYAQVFGQQPLTLDIVVRLRVDKSDGDCGDGKKLFPMF